MTDREPNVRAGFLPVALLLVGAIWAAPGAPVLRAQSGEELSAADRAEIQQLSERYLRALNACAAEEYAALFAPDGYFESTFRGRVQGREKLIELVRSERHCKPGAPARAAGSAPTMTIRPAPDGAVGTATLGNKAGSVEEHYVRTPQGWRFKSRTVFTAEELASGTGPGRAGR